MTVAIAAYIFISTTFDFIEVNVAIVLFLKSSMNWLVVAVFPPIP